MAKFNKFSLIKLLREVYIYNFVDNVDINKDKTDNISEEFLESQTPFRLCFFKLKLKVRAPIILLHKLYLVLKKYNKTQMIIT